MDEQKSIRYCRFPRREILWFCDKLEHDVGRTTRRSYAASMYASVLMALRFYASGSLHSIERGMNYITLATEMIVTTGFKTTKT